MEKYRRGTFQRNDMKPKAVAMLDTNLVLPELGLKYELTLIELKLTMVEAFFGISVSVGSSLQWGHVRIRIINSTIIITYMKRCMELVYYEGGMATMLTTLEHGRVFIKFNLFPHAALSRILKKLCLAHRNNKHSIKVTTFPVQAAIELSN